MHEVIPPAALVGYNNGSAVMTLVLPLGFFILVMIALYFVFTRPHTVPGHRAGLRGQAGRPGHGGGAVHRRRHRLPAGDEHGRRRAARRAGHPAGGRRGQRRGGARLRPGGPGRHGIRDAGIGQHHAGTGPHHAGPRHAGPDTTPGPADTAPGPGDTTPESTDNTEDPE